MISPAAHRMFNARLRTRLFFSLLPLVLVLFALGIYAITLFSRLANRVDQAINGHYRNIFAAQAMGQSLAIMEREAPTFSDTRTGENHAFTEARKRFEEKMADLRENVASTPGNFGDRSAALRELSDQLATNYDAFLKSLPGLGPLRNPKDRDLERAYLVSAGRMSLLLERIREQNFQSVLTTSNDIQESARSVTQWMIAGMGVVIVLFAYSGFHLSRAILRPIQLVTRATRELGEGNPAPPVPVVSQDELGELAVAFNKMAAQLEEYRQNTSEEIVRLHRTMEATLASFPDPIFVLNRDGVIELKNPAAEMLAAELQLNGRMPDKLEKIARDAMESGRSFLPHSFDEAVSFRTGGGEKSYLPRVLAMRDKEDALFGAAVVLYDVTRFRLLDSAKSNLVATVSHELNTPLTSVRMALHLLLERSVGTLNSKQDELLQAARTDTERLLRILNDLLDLTRLEQGNEGLRKEHVLPSDLLRSVTEDCADKIASRGLNIRCRLEPDLPAVQVDRQRVSHVFSNLVANAIKYSPAGGEILLSAARAEEDTVEFGVTDQGPGIAEEYQARIFERFFRVPGQTKTGAGLGLSIAREITIAHGGRIRVKSLPGQGATFYAAFKIAPALP
ncbi:MAG: ATP-binding protein [Verrucomicrobiota bacterium]